MRQAPQVFLYKALRPYKHTGIFVRSILSTLVLSRGIWMGIRRSRSSTPVFLQPVHQQGVNVTAEGPRGGGGGVILVRVCSDPINTDWSLTYR